MRKLVISASALAFASPVSAEPVQVRITGMTNADNVLVQDIMQHVALFGGAFNCRAPSTIATSVIPASSVPSSAAYRVPNEHAFYEDWEADFCGKKREFFITHWPDPNGGSFLKVTYPYPTGAPHGRR